MDSSDNFLNELKAFVEAINEDYLVGLTNKGTVNRAKKDLEKVSSLEYKICEDCVEFKFDDITCSITENVNNYKCSCISRSMCKHIIMGYIYIINNRDKFFNCKENNTEKEEIIQDFSEILEYPIDKIKKNLGEKSFFNIIRRIDFGINYKITETSLIAVDFPDENVSVKLLKDIDSSICSCKSKDLCNHKAEAIILYKIQKSKLSMEELKGYYETSKIINRQEIKEASEEIRNLINEIFVTGLSRLSSTIMDKINSLSLVCHNYDLPAFEKNLRGIKEELNLYFNKNAQFKNEVLLNKLSSLYNKTIKLENTDNISIITDIIGEFKSSYYEIPCVELYGIGEEKWSAKSGYEGITFYFYENHKKQFFTYTKSSPTFYDGYNQNRYLKDLSNEAPWNLNCSLTDLNKIHIRLIHGKINDKRRISSSKESKGYVLDESNIEKLNLEAYIYEDFSKLIDIFKNNKNYDEINNLVFIKAESFGESSFDNINQKFVMYLEDNEGYKVVINIDFSLRTKKTINTLERIWLRKEVPMFLGRVYLKEGQIMFYPINYYIDGRIESLT